MLSVSATFCSTHTNDVIFLSDMHSLLQSNMTLSSLVRMQNGDMGSRHKVFFQKKKWKEICEPRH